MPTIDPTKIYVHVTDLTSFMSCRRFFHFDVQRNLEPADGDRGKHLWFGTRVHNALKHYYRDGLDLIQTIRDDIEENPYSDPAWSLLCERVLERYHSYDQKDQEIWETVSVEEELHYPIPGTNAILVGTIDRVKRRRDNPKVLAADDHKTCSQMPFKGDYDLNHQGTGYIWLLEKCFPDCKVSGVYFNHILKGYPEKPPVLKKPAGQLSRSKDLYTTYDLYLEAIHEYNLDPDDYQAQLEYWKVNQITYYERFFTSRSRFELVEFEKDLTAVVEDLTRPGVRFYPNIHPDNCKFCPFKQPCKMMNEGSDVDEYLRRHFKTKVNDRT